jgi:GNAT superfamily N-acetyltransferase
MTKLSIDPPVLTRLARPEDLPEVHRMLIALAAQHGVAATVTPQVLDRIALRGRAARLIVALRPDSPQRHPVGFALLLVTRNMVADANWGFVEQLYVQVPDRKRGIARALVGAAKAAAAQAKCAGVTVATRPECDGAVLDFRASGLGEMSEEPEFAEV